MRPVPDNIPITLGYRQKMRSRPSYIHRGVDFGAPVGTTVRAAKGGKIVHAGRGGMGPAFGIHVVIKTADGIYVITAHMSSESVSAGQTVKMGDVLGKSGATGNVTGPHVHYGEFTSFSYLADRTPQYLDDVAAPAKPAQVKPRPAKVEPDLWFGVDFRNLAGFNDEGARTLDVRIPKIVADIGTVGREVVCVVELPNPKVKDFTRRMSLIGYKHAAGDLGRHIFVLKGIETVGAKIFDLKPRLRGDDKQGVAVQITPSVTPALIVTGQLENEDASGKTQVAQANSLVDQGEEYADRRGVPHSRIVWVVDTNSNRRVRAEVFERRGYVDAFDVAYSAENPDHQSFVQWGDQPAKGDRIDLIAVHKSRPVRRARLRLTPILTDHLAMFADIGTTPKK
jgi:hypothetical protein